MSLTKPKGAKAITVDMLNHAEVLLLPNRKIFEKFIEINEIEEDDICPGGVETCRGFAANTTREGVSHFVIYLQEDCDLRTVVHESVHMATYILDALGVHFDADHSEVLAYLTDYLYQQCCEVVGPNA